MDHGYRQLCLSLYEQIPEKILLNQQAGLALKFFDRISENEWHISVGMTSLSVNLAVSPSTIFADPLGFVLVVQVENISLWRFWTYTQQYKAFQ